MLIENYSYNPEWQNNRLKFLISKYEIGFWSGKKVLELGSFNGALGDFFRRNGSDVLSVEGREENVNNIKQNFPKLKVIKSDLDTDQWSFGKFDIIIHFGLLYHFEKYHQASLENCLKNCNLLFLETVIFDSYKNTIYFRNEHGIDQSLTNIGGTPSTKYINDILDKNTCIYEICSSSCLNSGAHKYDWIEENSNSYNGYNRRFWIIKTSAACERPVKGL